jgi:hypothetical protein
MIKAGMTLAEAIIQLTRGFRKFTGRDPDGLEKIKIKQEASQRIKDLEKVVDMEGNVIDTSKGIMGGKQIKKAMGGRIGLKEGNGKDDSLTGITMTIEERMKRIRKLMEELEKAKKGIGIDPDPEDEQGGGGGRTEFKDGMNRRNFLKIMGGLASIPIVGKFFKIGKVGKTVSKVPVIKTADVAGKPEWFDALVNKVILEGDDVTKKFATGERQTVHSKTLDDGSVVRVTQDTDQGAVRVEYDSDANVFEDTVQMEYKKPLPDEGDPNPAPEFTTAESGPVGRQTGPDDYDIDVDEVGGTSISDLDSDVSALKKYATGKLNMKEIVDSINRKKKAQKITEGGDEMIDAVTKRQGDYDPYATGGRAGFKIGSGKKIIQKITKPKKTLKSIEETGTINISDEGIASEFERFMKQTDPDGYAKIQKIVDDLNQKIELKKAKKEKGRKENASGGVAYMLGE